MSSGMESSLFGVMAGLVPTIHALILAQHSKRGCPPQVRAWADDSTRCAPQIKTPAQLPGFFTQTPPVPKQLLNANATHATKNVGARWRLQLAVFAEHSAPLVAEAAAVSGKRRPAAQQIGPSHAARPIAHSCRGRLAWCELGKIDRLRGRAGKRDRRPDQQACEYHWLHPQSSLAVFGKAVSITVL